MSEHIIHNILCSGIYFDMHRSFFVIRDVDCLYFVIYVRFLYFIVRMLVLIILYVNKHVLHSDTVCCICALLRIVLCVLLCHSCYASRM